ncbi:Bor family protein [Thalassolituus sp. LLYu03]|uniref:Bor family protein n=1 Tax=Thalassolituus sp. LLYu03 TaxID=3421656 RepID=UPI003D2CC3B9
MTFRKISGGTARDWLALMLPAFLLLSACSSVTIRPYGGEKDTAQPDYQVSKPFYWFGLSGEHEVNTSLICGQRRVMQMQAVTTLADWLQGLVTLGIYSPRTAKVWCETQPVMLMPLTQKDEIPESTPQESTQQESTAPESTAPENAALHSAPADGGAHE